MIETLVEIITKMTDLATYDSIWLVLIISLIVMYGLIVKRVREALASVVSVINSIIDVLSILSSELRVRNIIPYEVFRDILDKLLKSHEVLTFIRAKEVVRKAKFKHLHPEDIEKAKTILSKKELSEEDIAKLNRIAHLIFYEWKRKPARSDLLTAYILLRLIVSSRHSEEPAQRRQTSESAKG